MKRSKYSHKTVTFSFFWYRWNPNDYILLVIAFLKYQVFVVCEYLETLYGIKV